jgi:hypothetical protein
LLRPGSIGRLGVGKRPATTRRHGLSSPTRAQRNRSGKRPWRTRKRNAAAQSRRGGFVRLLHCLADHCAAGAPWRTRARARRACDPEETFWSLACGETDRPLFGGSLHWDRDRRTRHVTKTTSCLEENVLLRKRRLSGGGRVSCAAGVGHRPICYPRAYALQLAVKGGIGVVSVPVKA